jgi:hypothetical protein
MLFKWMGCSLVWMGCNLIVDKMLLTSMGCSLGYKIDTRTTLEYICTVPYGVCINVYFHCTTFIGTVGKWMLYWQATIVCCAGTSWRIFPHP